MALKDRHNGAPWYSWETPLKHRQADALWQARQELKDEIEFYCFCQYLFSRQWKKLKAYAQKKNIRIIGSTLRSRAPEMKAQILAQLVDKVWPKVASGEIRPTIHAVLPIIQAEAAHDLLYKSQNVGKVVLTLEGC